MPGLKIDYDFSGEETVPCIIKDGWFNCGKSGQYFGNIMIGNRHWAIILWDDEEDPDMHKAEGIQVAQTVWKGIDI